MGQRRIVIATCAGVVWIALGTPVAASPMFMGLGPPNAEGGFFHLGGISGDGSAVVGQWRTRAAETWPARWTATEGIVRLGNLAGGTGDGRAIRASGDGSVIVGSSDMAGGEEAFRWTATEGMVGLGIPDADLAGSMSRAFAVSADGATVVGWSDSEQSGRIVFRWTAAEGMRDLTGLRGERLSGQAFGVSGDGAVIVGALGNFGEPFRWTAHEGAVGLGFLGSGGARGNAAAVTPDGSMVVGSAASALGVEAFVWTEAAGMVGLGELAGGKFWSAASDISADGSVIVGASVTGPVAGGAVASRTRPRPDVWEAFIWDAEHGMRNLQDTLLDEFGLDLSGWTLRYAAAISDDGRTIVGNGFNPDGNSQAWIAQIPEPASGVLLVAGAIGCCVRRLRRRRA